MRIIKPMLCQKPDDRPEASELQRNLEMLEKWIIELKTSQSQ